MSTPFVATIHDFTTNEAENRNILRPASYGARCHFVAKVMNISLADEWNYIIPAKMHISSVEVYSDGSVNLFLRDMNSEVAKKIIAIRPVRGDA